MSDIFKYIVDCKYEHKDRVNSLIYYKFINSDYLYFFKQNFMNKNNDLKLIKTNLKSYEHRQYCKLDTKFIDILEKRKNLLRKEYFKIKLKQL